MRNKTKLKNPNPILQNENRSRVRERRSVPTSFEKKCSLKQKHSGSHTKHSLVPTTSPLLSPSTIKKKKKGREKRKRKKQKQTLELYYSAANTFKAAKQKQKQILLPATVNESFCCSCCCGSRANLQQHSRESERVKFGEI